VLVVVVVNSHSVVREQLVVLLFVEWIAISCVSLANHAIRVAGIGIGSAAPGRLST
jgi:hypothetical protein